MENAVVFRKTTGGNIPPVVCLHNCLLDKILPGRRGMVFNYIYGTFPFHKQETERNIAHAAYEADKHC